MRRTIKKNYSPATTDAVREYQMTTDCLIFQNGFKLGARIMLEVMEE